MAYISSCCCRVLHTALNTRGPQLTWFPGASAVPQHFYPAALFRLSSAGAQSLQDSACFIPFSLGFLLVVEIREPVLDAVVLAQAVSGSVCPLCLPGDLLLVGY